MPLGWSSYPDAVPRRQRPLPPVEPGRVVGVGALCDLDPHYVDEAGDQHFLIGEFVTLEDGRRVTLHDERGVTVGVRGGAIGGGPVPASYHLTLESLTRDVLNVVLPDPESGEEHPWEWLAELAEARGLEATANDLRRLPYEVVFTEEVRSRLGQ